MPTLMKSYFPKTCLFFLASVASSAFCASSVDAQSLQQAKSAAAFVDSIGLGTKFTYPDTPYLYSFPQAKQKLLDLGVSHIRDGVARESYKYEPMRDLCNSGIRLHTGVGERIEGYRGPLDFGKLDNSLGVIKDHYLGCVESIEGPNEYDIVRFVG